MGKVYEKIDDRIRDFLMAQRVFFVATAPSDPDGHVNLSPKGLTDSFAVLSPHKVAYYEYGGSGIETMAHLRDNNRIVLMVCAFDGPPKIYRLHGHGESVLADDPRAVELIKHFPAPPHVGLRSIVVIDVTRVSDSCGYGVPLMSYEGDRDLLVQFWDHKTPEQREHYRATRNAHSIDGAPVFAER
ncbi:pyridoxamine 5'-phosphate oxidase family protein [Catellatospora sichuanensis]|uniref:pyridoxamine 5'-phosphate oxidase family protein n=1 Tax=Catellatospora sichuanensis TaxID=1969805 RepID=UPI001183A511|nr:pyridoxamine 5'-phosphate oxidase family protein [Catellatospora sichuanensis]